MLALAALPLLKHMTPFWHARGYAYACGEAVCSRVSCKINIVGGVSLFARAPRVMAGPLSPRRAADAFFMQHRKALSFKVNYKADARSDATSTQVRQGPLAQLSNLALYNHCMELARPRRRCHGARPRSSLPQLFRELSYLPCYSKITPLNPWKTRNILQSSTK